MLGALATAAVALSVAVLPAAGAGVFDPVVTLGSGSSAGTLGLITVTLADGSTLSAWPSADGKGVFARARAAGSSAWGPVRGRALATGFTIAGGSGFGARVDLDVSGPHRVLLSWTEQHGAAVRSVTSELSESLPSIPAPVPVTAADSSTNFHLASNANGRAVAVWVNTTSSSGPVRASIRPSAAAGWSAPVTLSAAGTAADNAVAAITAQGSLCAAWTRVLPSPVDVQTRCRTGTSYGPVTSVVHPASLVVGNRLALVTSPRGFDLAVVVETSGANGFPANPAVSSSRLELFNRATAQTPWHSLGVKGPPGHVAFDPQAVAAPNGRLLVQFRTLDGTIGSTTTLPSYTLSTYVLERNLVGTWSGPMFFGGFGTGSSVYLGLYTGAPAIGNSGTAVVPMVVPAPGNTWRIDAYLRSGPSGGFAPSTLEASSALLGLPAVSTSGRVTVGVYDINTHNVLSRSTPLPHPVALLRATISAVPRVHVAAHCAITWSDAASSSVVWMRDGAVIPGATGLAYQPSTADQAHLLSCRARAVNPAGATLSVSIARRVS